MALGASRNKYLYVDDAGKNWIVNIASDRATVTPSPGLTPYNPASPPSGGVQGKLDPKRCRRVHVQGLTTLGEAAGGLIKRDIICNVTSALYVLNFPQNVTYKPGDEPSGTTITLVSTGRRGERITF